MIVDRDGGDQRERGGEGCVARSHQGLLTAAVPRCGRAREGRRLCCCHAPAPDSGGGCGPGMLEWVRAVSSMTTMKHTMATARGV